MLDFVKSANTLSVKELTRILKAVVEGATLLQSVWVRGELSNFRHHTSGHLYFTLKDDSASLRCVMFKGRAQRLKFRPEDGMGVLALGSVSVYERDGQYQLYVDDIEPDGVGSLYKAFLQLKSRLEADGLFEQTAKRKLPRFPRRVGVVTSLKGAAVRDIVTIAKRRWPGVRLVLADVTVQGDSAPADIIRGLSLVAAVPDVDVIILGRGGGSIEELWAFNDEALARAIRACPIPVVSAVGHETDFTIADFVADMRAPTPSAAAELVVPDIVEVRQRISVNLGRMSSAVRRALMQRRYALDALRSRPVLRRGQDLLAQRRQRLDDLRKSLTLLVEGGVDLRMNRVRIAAARLDALSPLKILSRGYSICTLQDGALVKNSESVELGAHVSVRLDKGSIGCEVVSKNECGGGTHGG